MARLLQPGYNAICFAPGRGIRIPRLHFACLYFEGGWAEREEEREGEHGRGRGDDENGRVSAIGDPPVFAAQVTKP